MNSKVRFLTEVSLLSVFITLTGAFKIPSLFPGAEFQLSAPIAVAICTVFGFKKYILAGFISSSIGLILGTQNLLNVAIAMIFRLTVGLVIAAFGKSPVVISIAGPIGSFMGRLALGGLIGKAVIPLLIAAVPGMIFTACLSYPMAMVFKKVTQNIGIYTKVRGGN